jgi:hypothetical protein
MRPRFAPAGHTLLGEPLDGAGNRGSGVWLQQAQARDLRRTRPLSARAVSRLSRATRRSHGSLTQDVSRRKFR